MDISLSFSFPRHLQNYGPDEETIPGRENNRSETRRNREGVKREERFGVGGGEPEVLILVHFSTFNYPFDHISPYHYHWLSTLECDYLWE